MLASSMWENLVRSEEAVARRVKAAGCLDLEFSECLER